MKLCTWDGLSDTSVPEKRKHFLCSTVRVLSIPFITDLDSLELVEEIASEFFLAVGAGTGFTTRNIGYSWWLKTGPLSLSHIA